MNNYYMFEELELVRETYIKTYVMRHGAVMGESA